MRRSQASAGPVPRARPASDKAGRDRRQFGLSSIIHGEVHSGCFDPSNGSTATNAREVSIIEAMRWRASAKCERSGESPTKRQPTSCSKSHRTLGGAARFAPRSGEIDILTIIEPSRRIGYQGAKQRSSGSWNPLTKIENIGGLEPFRQFKIIDLNRHDGVRLVARAARSGRTHVRPCTTSSPTNSAKKRKAHRGPIGCPLSGVLTVRSAALPLRASFHILSPTS